LPRIVYSQEIFQLQSLCHIEFTVELRMILSSTITASTSVTSGQIASNLPAVCGAVAATFTRSAPRKRLRFPPQHVSSAGWRKEKTPYSKISRLQTRKGGDAEKEVAENTEDYNEKDVS
jgi:hypothetical protein